VVHYSDERFRCQLKFYSGRENYSPTDQVKASRSVAAGITEGGDRHVYENGKKALDVCSRFIGRNQGLADVCKKL
jgi:hypothetical protein